MLIFSIKPNTFVRSRISNVHSLKLYVVLKLSSAIRDCKLMRGFYWNHKHTNLNLFLGRACFKKGAGGLKSEIKYPIFQEQFLSSVIQIMMGIEPSIVRHVDYFSLDVEGAEVHILNSLDCFTFGVLSIEVQVQENRQEIHNILKSNPAKGHQHERINPNDFQALVDHSGGDPPSFSRLLAQKSARMR